MGNMDIYEKYRAVPQEACKTIGAGRLKGMTDINPMWRIKALTEAFGVCGFGWYYDVDRKWIEVAGNEAVAFVDISLYIKMDGEWSKPIHGTGGSKLIAMEKNGQYVSDEAYKMATTDAISVACKQLGFGADVYWNADSTKYNKPEPPTQKIRIAEINYLYQEMKRTGVSENRIKKMYNIQDLHDMTVDDYENCIQKFNATPNAGESR